MKLKLTKFKQYDNLSLELPDTGLVLLKGRSGVGKTSVLLSVAFALRSFAKDIKPWRGGVPKVELEKDGMQITRTRAPNTLEVNYQGKVYKDDEAESLLEQHFGNDEEFFASKYIRQRAEGSLLRKSPADQLKMIQRLAFGEDDPEEFKKRISEIISARNKEIQNINGSQEYKQSRLSHLDNMITQFKEGHEEPPPPPVNESMDDLNSKRQELEEKRQNLTAKRKEIADQLRDERYELVAKFDANKQSYEKRLQELKNGYDELDKEHKQLEEEYKSFDSVTQYDTLLNGTIPKKKRYVEYKTEAQSILEEVSQVFSDFDKTKQSATEFLNSEMERLTRVSEATLSSKTQLESQLKLAREAKECPECGTSLVLQGDKLAHIGEGSNQSLNKHLEKLECQLEEIEKEKGAVDEDIARVTSFLNRLNAVKEKKTPDPDPELPEEGLDNLLEQKTRDRARAYEIENKLLSIKDKKSAALQDQAKVEKDLELLQEQYDSAAEGLPDKSKLEKDLNNLDNLLSNTQNKLTEVDGSIRNLSEYEKSLSQYKERQQKIDSYEEQKADIQKDLDEDNAKEERVTKKLEAAKRMKQISDKASTDAVEEILYGINSNAQYYISRLFPDDGTVVQLKNKTTVSDGSERDKLSLEITHKGESAGKKIDPLSGGEVDRIVLAYQLSLADMYGSDLLMIDEGFNGADTEESMPNILELLQEVSKDRLILMIQHGVPEHYFDKVIHFDQLGDNNEAD